MHQVLEDLPRNDRRLALRAERIARESGNWGDWERVTFPAGSAGNGWAGEFTEAYRNKVFCALSRMLPNGVRHIAVTSLSQERPSWPEMQRIKDELAGLNATGIEVYPPHDRIVDDAPMYHLWILAEPLGFGLK